MIKTAILVQKKNKNTNLLEWALVSRKDRKVLKWFGEKKPSDERVQKEEKRIQFFKHQSERLEKIQKLEEESNQIEEIKLSIRQNNIIKEAADPAEKTAESLFKIIQFLQYRVPKKNKKKYLNRIKGKVIKLSPTELGEKKIPLSSVIGQSIAISKNILSGLSPVFINKVLEKLIRLLISNQEN
jgi:transcription termination factor NusB